MYILQFTVQGGGVFPVDMLRYDSCFPAQPNDVLEITRAATASTSRRVNLVRRQRNKTEQLTTDRWRSFGWEVDPRSIKVHRAP